MIETHGQEGMHSIWFVVVLYLLVSFTAAELMSLMLLLAMPLILILRVLDKRIQITPEGCMVKTLFFKHFYRWSELQTVRYMDFEKPAVAMDQRIIRFIDTRLKPLKFRSRTRSDYGVGILFSTRKLGRYPVLDPDTYHLLHDPFCLNSFYIQLLPESDFYEWSDGYKKSKFYPYPVKREEFMARAGEWGLKIEGLNVPMPPEANEEENSTKIP